MNRKQLQDLTKVRLAEARVLLAAKLYDGAYYLTGYAVECALKSCIAKQIKKYDFPDKKLAIGSHTHNLEELLNVTGSKQAHSNEVASNPDLKLNWLVVKDWSEQARYTTGRSKAEAKDLYAAVTARKNGILRWLKKQW